MGKKVLTISESIIEWLKSYNSSKIDTDFLKTVSDSFGLFKQPSEIVRKDVLGNQIHTEYYTLRMRFDSKVNDERISNQAYCDALRDWIDAQEAARNYPTLCGKRCEGISVSMPGFAEDTESDTSTYQMTICIVWRKENA